MGALVKAVLVLVLAGAAFLSGAAYGSRDRLCVTAGTPSGTVVYCANGKPAVNLETVRAARAGGRL